jgi:hypothetical protein
MPKNLIVLNALLLALAVGGAVYIVRQLTSPMPVPQLGQARPAPPAPAPVEPPAPPPGGYASVAARNLFSPTRTESPPTPTVASSASPAVKPNLFGIVLREGSPVAYLEDPNTKRVAGYRVGDSVAGGTVQTINSEGVVINRPDGNMDVRLRDPSKPRPTPVALPPGAAVGAQPGVVPGQIPGVIPPAGGVPGAVPPAVAQPPGQLVPPGTPPTIPGRRTLPPNLLRRLPQAQQGDAAPQQ